VALDYRIPNVALGRPLDIPLVPISYILLGNLPSESSTLVNPSYVYDLGSSRSPI